MGADILVIRHESTNVPAELANYVDINNINTAIINAGDGYHSHPSQGLLDLFTLATFFNPVEASTKSLSFINVVIATFQPSPISPSL